MTALRAEEVTALPSRTDTDDIRPIFLLSVQRSGSTLLQRMLASHPRIATVSEPWVLLPFMYSMRREGVYAEYQHRAMVAALADFTTGLPDGWDTYRGELRRLALNLYRQAAGDEASYFLDKSPRYALVIDELAATFPEAKFVVLWRHPLAVVASIVRTWGDGGWNVETHKGDLYDGLTRLVDGYQAHADRFHALRYEDLLDDPEGTLAAVFDYLDLPPWEAAVGEFAGVELRGRMGDPKGVDAYGEVSREPLTKWRTTLDNPFRTTWCRRYLRIIGRHRLEVMGYDLDAMLEDLESSPTSMRGVASDAYRSGRGFVRNLLETPLLRSKLAKLPRSHGIHRHG